MGDTEWMHVVSADDGARFVLGTVGEHPFVCVGVNPSTATPERLDATVTRVARRAAALGFDSWVMLNLYPQRSTDPADLHERADAALVADNERAVADILRRRPGALCAAWGTLIGSRPYLAGLARRVIAIADTAGCSWSALGNVTAAGHPRHPLYVRGDAPLVPFNARAYAAQLP